MIATLIKKIVSVLLLVVVTLFPQSACVHSGGADVPVQQQVTAAAHHRADKSFAELQYGDFDTTAIYAAMDELRDLVLIDNRREQVLADYDTMAAEYDRFADTLTWNSILADVYPADQAYTDRKNELLRVDVDLSDDMGVVISEILSSAYRDALLEHTGDDGLLAYEDYEGISDEENALLDRQLALQDEYNRCYTGAREITAEYAGETWTEARLTSEAGTLSDAEYYGIYRALSEAENKVMGQILLDLVDVNNQLAALYGYDNYFDMQWTEVYGRDYTYEEFNGILDAVKKYVSPSYADFAAVSDRIDSETQGVDLSVADYFSRAAQNTALTDELREAFAYISAHGLCVLGGADSYEGAYATKFYALDEPVVYVRSEGTVQDVLGLVHESGHAANFYFSDVNCLEDSLVFGCDVAEIQSHGMQTVYAADIARMFPGDEEEIGTGLVLDVLDALVGTAMQSEIEHMLYTTADLTLDKANQLAAEIFNSYSLGYTMSAYYDWSQIPHYSQSPGYVPSYVTSAAAALALWLEGRTDEASMKEKYGAIVQLPSSSVAFRALCNDYNLDVFDAAFYKKMVAALRRAYL